MNKAKVMRKAEAGEGLTVAEIKVYQKAVKPEKGNRNAKAYRRRNLK